VKWSAEKEAQKRQSQPKKTKKKWGKKMCWRLPDGRRVGSGTTQPNTHPLIQASIRTSRIKAYIAYCMYVHVYSTVVCRDRLSAISSRVRDDCAD
jgi:hypothetical protein